jgi:hypothetical protein
MAVGGIRNLGTIASRRRDAALLYTHCARETGREPVYLTCARISASHS